MSVSSRSSTPNTMLVLGADGNATNNNLSMTEHRPGSGSLGKVPPRPGSSSSNRRTPTPLKQVPLQAVRRKENRDDMPFEDIDWKEVKSSMDSNSHRHETPGDLEVVDKQMESLDLKSQDEDVFSLTSVQCSAEEDLQMLVEGGVMSARTSQSQTNKVVEAKAEASKAESEEEDSSSEEDTEEEERKAPTQLLMEFLASLMEEDYQTAEKLCKMILIYEPSNAEALKFQPLIQEKIQLDEEDENEDEEGESDDSGEEEDDDDDDDDDDEDDDDSSEESEESENEGEEGGDENKPDSGIASASSD